MNERKPKVYAPLNGKEIVFESGGVLLKLSANAEKLIAFIKQHANERGYINLKVERKREADQYGNTHSVQLDTYAPKPREDTGNYGPPRQQAARSVPPVRDASPTDV